MAHVRIKVVVGGEKVEESGKNDTKIEQNGSEEGKKVPKISANEEKMPENGVTDAKMEESMTVKINNVSAQQIVVSTMEPIQSTDHRDQRNATVRLEETESTVLDSESPYQNATVSSMMTTVGQGWTSTISTVSPNQQENTVELPAEDTVPPSIVAGGDDEPEKLLNLDFAENNNGDHGNKKWAKI